MEPKLPIGGIGFEKVVVDVVPTPRDLSLRVSTLTHAGSRERFEKSETEYKDIKEIFFLKRTLKKEKEMTREILSRG